MSLGRFKPVSERPKSASERSKLPPREPLESPWRALGQTQTRHRKAQISHRGHNHPLKSSHGEAKTSHGKGRTSPRRSP